MENKKSISAIVLSNAKVFILAVFVLMGLGAFRAPLTPTGYAYDVMVGAQIMENPWQACGEGLFDFEIYGHIYYLPSPTDAWVTDAQCMTRYGGTSATYSFNPGHGSVVNGTFPAANCVAQSALCHCHYETTISKNYPLPTTIGDKKYYDASLTVATTYGSGNDQFSLYTHLCPVDCEGDWGACSTTCGGGTQNFNVTVEPSIGGSECPESPRACNTQACPVATGTISQTVADPKAIVGTNPAVTYSSNPAVTLSLNATNTTAYRLSRDGTLDSAYDWVAMSSFPVNLNHTYPNTDTCGKKMFVFYRNNQNTVTGPFQTHAYCLDRQGPNVTVTVTATEVVANCTGDRNLSDNNAGAGCKLVAQTPFVKLAEVASATTACPTNLSAYTLNSPHPRPTSGTKYYCGAAPDMLDNLGVTSLPVAAGGLSTCSLRGDVDCNNVVNQADLALVRRYMVNYPLGLPITSAPTNVNWNNGDTTACTGNAGNINTKDIAFYHIFLQSGSWPTCIDAQ